MTSTNKVKIFIINEEIDMYLFIFNEYEPDIADSDVWSLVGGEIQHGENPYIAIQRILTEEINIEVSNIKQIRSRKTTDEIKGRVFEIQGYYFIGITDIYDISKIKLKGGQKAEFFSLEDIMKEPNISDSIAELLDKKYLE